MKKFFKWVFIIIILSFIAGGAYYVYDNYIVKQNVRTNLSVIPNDPIFIISSSNLSKGWTNVSNSNIWHHLLENPYFKGINEYAELLDQFLKDNKVMDMLLGNRELLISAHMISVLDYNFLFVVDLQSSKTLSKGIDAALKLITAYDVKKSVYHKTEVIQLTELKDPSNIIYFYIADNLLVCSFNSALLERSIDQKDNNYWQKNTQYQDVTNELSGNGLLKFYFNYKKLPSFMNIYLKDMEEYTKGMADALSFSAFNIKLEDDQLIFDGYTALDSLPSYYSALSDVKPGKIKAFEILSDQTALYFSIGFKSYKIFYESMINQYKKGNTQGMEDLEKNKRLTEKLLNINIEKDFFDWIGEEIAIVKLKPSGKTRLEDVVVAIHANNIKNAENGLSHITNQIRKRSPVKFKEIDYKNFKINYLKRKGFFKMFFGKLFKKLEKPYYTFIEDFVVLSNSQDALKQIIDDYLLGHTLSHDEAFMDFKDNFEVKSNLNLWIQIPKLYDNLIAFSTPESKRSLNEYKSLIMSFNRIGFQLVSEGDVFKTMLIADHDQDALLKTELDNLERKTTASLKTEDFDSLRFKIILADSILANNGAYKSYYENNTQIQIEGRIDDNQLNGIWRTYYAEGNLKSSVNYKNGKVDGIAYFYYDDSKETKMAEIKFKDDKINGLYQEYYENGAQKANLNYEEGILNGEAAYFYKTGRTKIEGKYKKGRKKGRWIFYDEQGKVINKKRVKD